TADAYAAGAPFDVPGGGRVRTQPDRVAQVQDLTRGIRRHCSTFVTLPGLNSLYLWSGEPAPVEVPGPWMFFLTADDQRKIVDEIRDIPRLCAVQKPRQRRV